MNNEIVNPSKGKELRDLANKQHKKFLVSQIGTTQNVLIENNSVGHATNFSKIKLGSLPLFTVERIVRLFPMLF